MGIRKVTGGGANIPGIGALANWQEWLVIPGYNASAQDTNWGGTAFQRTFPSAYSGGSPVTSWVGLGNQASIFRVVNDQQVIDVFAIAGVIGTQECVNLFRGGLIGNGFTFDFTPTFPPSVEAAPGVTPRLAFSCAAWLRKKAAGDATSCAQFFGIANYNGEINRSTRVARIGVMGDGALGFRFGSVNCPDAPAGGADNGSTDIDANSVQPVNLINPGANWFHVRIKMIPATESQTGRVGCFYNGRLVATFTNTNNFPRTSRSGVDTSGAAYLFLSALIAAFGNGGAAPSPGYYIRDIRCLLTEDMTL